MIRHWRSRSIGWQVRSTSLGPVLLAASENGICCLAFEDSETGLRRRFPGAQLMPAGARERALFDRAVAAIDQPGEDARSIPLDLHGTAFQHRVWEELRRIPPGQTRSYGELAAALGQPGAARAVGRANGANRVAVLIPCHRVIAADGGLGGYAYGEAIKRELLRRERGD